MIKPINALIWMMIPFFVSTPLFLGKLVPDQWAWYFEIGASNHMTVDASNLHTCKGLDNMKAPWGHHCSRLYTVHLRPPDTDSRLTHEWCIVTLMIYGVGVKVIFLINYFNLYLINWTLLCYNCQLANSSKLYFENGSL